jgi:hypothetical protein
MLTQLTYCTITHAHDSFPILYLDTGSPIYKSALSIPKTSDLTWLSSQYLAPSKPPVSPLVAILVDFLIHLLPSLNHS